MLKPGQHVMFEHGSLRTVMDGEDDVLASCPPEEKPGMSLADALLRGGQNTPVTPEVAAAIHPFPTAQSDGLAAPGPPPCPKPRARRHVQVATTLAFEPSAGEAKRQPRRSAPVIAVAPLPPPVKKSHNPFAAIGRFFKHLFVR